MRLTRRDFLKLSGLGASAGLMGPMRLLPGISGVRAPAGAMAPLAMGLSDPALQPLFGNLVPNALDPAFSYKANKNKYNVEIAPAVQYTGLVDDNGVALPTPVFGYGEKGTHTWPGKTIFATSGTQIEVKWKNKLTDPLTGNPVPHLLPVDTSIHWAYSLAGYEQYSIATNGVPIVAHLHGGHSAAIYDGNPEYFFSPGYGVVGPRWVEKKYLYDNDQPAGTLWYHDHALGITRLNVYAGMAGFYIVRDALDTGLPDNPLGLPAFPYEGGYAIQDRMFRSTGELFYSAFPGDPFYADFITGEGAVLPPDLFPGGGPTALAEFFGDHMVVNGIIWPKTDVEPRNYRLRFLNGCDSRFLVVRFRPVAAGATDVAGAGDPLPFWVIGSDQGLASAAKSVNTLVIEPGGRYDIVFDFAQVAEGNRVIMENIGGDSPFGGDFGDALDADDLFPARRTDRIMAFDVELPLDEAVLDDFDPAAIGQYGGNSSGADVTRKVALFEGTDEFGRLQPLLGVAEPTVDAAGVTVDGALAWHAPTTERPALDSTETWEIYNATGDAHPIHLHLVNFEILDRQAFTADVIPQPITQHDGSIGEGFRLENIQQLGDPVGELADYVENAPKDMVTALPGQVTRIKATFDKKGRYVWHCHILSHEDHEMMRVIDVI